MITTRITVSGPGTCIWPEMVRIQELLESYGAVVTVEDEYPAGEIEEERFEDAFEGREIILTAQHNPWGG